MSFQGCVRLEFRFLHNITCIQSLCLCATPPPKYVLYITVKVYIIEHTVKTLPTRAEPHSETDTRWWVFFSLIFTQICW